MSTVLDVEPVVLKELDESRPCEWTDCQKDATWECLLTCGCSGDICTPHKEMQRGYSNKRAGGTCNKCMTRGVHVVQWLPL